MAVQDTEFSDPGSHVAIFISLSREKLFSVTIFSLSSRACDYPLFMSDLFLCYLTSTCVNLSVSPPLPSPPLPPPPPPTMGLNITVTQNQYSHPRVHVANRQPDHRLSPPPPPSPIQNNIPFADDDVMMDTADNRTYCCLFSS